MEDLLTTIGGFRNALNSTNKLFSLTGEGNSKRWTEEYPPLPNKRYGVTALCTAMSLIVVGGSNDDGRPLKSIEVMNTETQQWYAAVDLPESLSWPLATICGDRLGGLNKDFKCTSVMYSSSLTALLKSQGSSSTEKRPAKQSSNRSILWNIIANLPVTGSTFVCCQDQLMAIGGLDSDGDITQLFICTTQIQPETLGKLSATC